MRAKSEQDIFDHYVRLWTTGRGKIDCTVEELKAAFDAGLRDEKLPSNLKKSTYAADMYSIACSVHDLGYSAFDLKDSVSIDKENNMIKENDNFIGRGRTQEGNIDYNFWYKFEKQIPHTMRFKQFDIIDGHILYWITQEYFTESDLEIFKDALMRLDSYIDEALIIPRDESRWDYKKDLKDSTGGYISLKDNYCGMWNESVQTNQDVRVPGTNVILEKGDRVRLVSKKNEADTQDVIFEDSNFVFKKIKFYSSSKNDNNLDEVNFTYGVDRKPNSKADDYVIDIYVDCHWNDMSVADSVEVKYGFKMNGPRNSITEFIKVLQDSLKFAEKVAAYLKVKVINR